MTLLELVDGIAEAFRAHSTNDAMSELGLKVGVSIVAAEEGLSKRERAAASLSGLSERELAGVARQLGALTGDYGLEEAGLELLERGQRPLSEITRRDVARCFGDDLAGEQSTAALVGRYYPLVSAGGLDFLGGPSLPDKITRHMDSNPGDWSVEYLFEQVGALTSSRTRFGELLEAAMHPLTRRGPEQAGLIKCVNDCLRRDGYELASAGEVSGYPLYTFRSTARGVQGAPKNLIFASNGPKPEIGFGDAINNDIVILSNQASCLIYDRAIRGDGLLWRELVGWWQAREGSPAEDAAQSLGRRLRTSLSSDAEHSLFEQYFKLYRAKLGDGLPALIPQVYLHYDPAVVKALRHRPGLIRQRMDFLLLLPGRARVVIEVDGVHHFAREDKPSLAVYAETVAADRELRLSGYEIYRFGANELVGPRAPAVLAAFFDRLWELHDVKS